MARSMALSPMRRSSPLPPPVVAMMPRPILVTDPSPEFHSTRVAHNNRAERQKEDLVICGDLQLISSGGHSERGRGPSIVLVTYRSRQHPEMDTHAAGGHFPALEVQMHWRRRFR